MHGIAEICYVNQLKTSQMKTTNYILISFMVLLMNITMLSDSNARNNNIDILNVQGFTAESGLLLDSVMVTIFDNNEIVYKDYTNQSGEFHFTLNTNKYYTVEFKKNGFFTKRIIFETNIHKHLKNQEAVEFSVNLIPEKKLEGINCEVLDFPVCKYSYDTKQKQFTYSSEFVINRSNEINDLFVEKKSLINEQRKTKEDDEISQL